MKNEQNLPPLFPLKKELQELTEHLKNSLAPDLIYLSPSCKEPIPLYVLHLVSNSKKELTTEEVDSLEKMQQKFPHFYVQWSPIRKIRKALVAGELFYLQHCFFGKICYSTGDRENPLTGTTPGPVTLLQKAEEKVEKDFNDFVELFSTTYEQFQKKNYAKATVDLIAVLEKLFCYTETLYKGEAENFISLQEHVNCLAVLNPRFKKLFDRKNDRIETMLLFMDHIHVTGFDPKKHEITHRGFYEMFVLVEVVFKTVHDIALGMLSVCTDLQNGRQPQTTTILNGENPYLPFDISLQQVLDFLRTQFEVHSVFLIRKQQHSIFEDQCSLRPTKDRQHNFVCTLLLVTHKPLPLNPAQLMDRVYNHSGKKMKVIFILETLPKLLKKLDFGDNFLHQMLHRENGLYQENDQLFSYLGQQPVYYPDQWNRINARWGSRIERANYLHRLSDAFDYPEDPIAYLVLIQNAMVQTCIGMLHVFWEYKPSYTSLSYLVQLCLHFSDFPKKILLNNSFESQRMFYLLSHAQQHMNFHCPYRITEDDKEKAHDLCSRFISEAEKTTARHLASLKIKSFQHDAPLHTKAL